MGEAEILNLKERMRLNDRGEVEPFIVATYKLSNGYEGEIAIPKKEFSDVKLKEKLKEEASKIENLLGKKVIF